MQDPVSDEARPDIPSDDPGETRRVESIESSAGSGVSPDAASAQISAEETPAPGAGESSDARRATVASREPRTLDTSAPAIAATVALVGFSIFIGVVGPRLGNRQPLPPGTTLVELADAMTARHSESVVGAIHAADEPPFERDEIAREFERLLGRDIAVPDLTVGLESLGFRWAGIRGVRMPGGAGAVAFGRFRGDEGPDFASVAVLRDQGRFIVYDPYGRPIPLPEGEMFSVAVEGRQFGSSVLAYREGDLVFAMQSDSPGMLERMAARFQAAAAAARVGAAKDRSASGGVPADAPADSAADRDPKP